MFGHWHFRAAAFLFFTSLSLSPAFSNPLTDLFDFAPKEAAAPAPAQEECVVQPGKSTARGQRWVYRIDGHRKCWFQADEATVSVKKKIHHHAAMRPAVVPEETEAAPRAQTVLDARAQLLNAAPESGPRLAASTPEVANTASVPARGAAMLVTAASIVAQQPTINQLTPDAGTPRSVDVEMLLAASASTLDKDTATSSALPATFGAPSIAGAEDWELILARAGMVLIALGFVFLVGSLLANHFFGSRGSGANVRRSLRH